MPLWRRQARSVRILIADDDWLFAESLMVVLNEEERLEVVGIAENGQQAVALAAELRPDVILMDLNMPVMDGLEATRRIRETGLETQILILSGTNGDMASKDAVAAGANAYLRKDAGVEELIESFLEVAPLAALLGAPKR
jgi:DNA-binding NarL/FixJ family response regulator